MNDPKAIADELRVRGRASYTGEGQDFLLGVADTIDALMEEIETLRDEQADMARVHHEQATVIREATERAERVEKERDEALANRDQFRNAWNAQGFEIIRLEDERDALAKERDMRASESADLERERDDLQADLDAEVDKNARYRTRNDELAAVVEKVRAWRREVDNTQRMSNSLHEELLAILLEGDKK